MDDSRARSNLESSVSSFLTSEGADGSLSEQSVTALPTLAVGVARSTEVSSFTFSYHWTVRCKIIEMDTRKASILLKVLVFEQLIQGIDFTGYLSVEYLVSYILKGKTDPLEITDERDRQACLLGILVLSATRGTWINLGDRIKFSPSLVQEVLDLDWLPDTRTYKSWKPYWRPQRFLEILTVPLDAYGLRDRIGAPYDSYCKGYGNGGHRSRIQKTPTDPEIDGEETERNPPRFTLQMIEQFAHIQFLIEKEKADRIQGD